MLLEARDGMLAAAATDMDSSASAECAAEVVEAGMAVVPAARLTKLVAGIKPDTEVRLKAVDDTVTVTAGRALYHLPTLPTDTFPTPLATGESTVEFVLDHATTLRLFERPAVAISNETTRYYLGGVFLHVEDGRLVGAATNGHALVRSKTDTPAPIMPENGGRPGIIVPAAACAEIVRLAKPGGVTLRTDGKVLEARAGSRSHATKLIDGTFPDYARVVPTASGCAVECARADLLGALERAGGAANGKFPAVQIAWGEGELTIMLPDETSADTITATARQPGKTWAPITKLIGLVETFDCERIVLDAANAFTPIRITQPDDAGLLALLMPVKEGAP
jgi:DNA polymerase-3 subunit beta